MTNAEDATLHRLLEEAKEDGCQELNHKCEDCTMAIVDTEGFRKCAIMHVLENI